MKLASVVLLTALGACDLKPPPPKSQPVTAMTPTAVAIDAAVAVDAAPAQMGSGAPAGSALPPHPSVPLLEPTEDCLAAGSKIAQTIIDSAPDMPTRNQLENDRSKIVKKASQACTRDKWPETVFACIRNAVDATGVGECTKTLKPPEPTD